MSDAPDAKPPADDAAADDAAPPAAASLDWFETLYASAEGNASLIPWGDRKANVNLIAWLERERPRTRGVRAIVIGCGLGDDAELLARWGYDVTAFDLSPTAIAWCRRRFPSSRVNYVAADLLNLPAAWRGAFGFVFEANTLQALPNALRPAATAAVWSLVAPGGRLLAIMRGRNDHEHAHGPPWPLTRQEVGALAGGELRMESFEDFDDHEDPPIRRFRAAFVRD